MEKIDLKKVDKTIYREVLDNGLEIIIIPNDQISNKKNYYFNYGTYYGAINNEFIPYEKTKMTKYPYGIAHFLEHKLFENETGEKTFDFFAKSGSYVNAFTSYKTTCYVVTGNKNLEENLEYLLNFVNTPYFTNENVQKEQGIIDEEIRMYEDDPDFLAVKTLNKNMFKNLPYNTPVAGSCDTIKKITKQKLYECYHTFYKPSNMFLVVGGKVNPKEIVRIVSNTLSKFNLPKTKDIKRKSYKEPLEPVKDYEELKVDVKIDKVAIGYKMARSNFTIKNDILLNLYLNMITSLCFGSSSKFKEEMRELKLVSRSGYYFQNLGDIITFNVEADCFNTDLYLKNLTKYLENLTILEEDLERIKKVWIASEVIKSDYADALVDSAVDDLINYHKIVTNYVDLIKSMNILTMQEVLKGIDFTQKSLVKILKGK